MALPTVKTLGDCTDFGVTVLPYLSQMKTLPIQLYQSYNDPQALKDIYLSTNPVITSLAFALYICFPIFWIVSDANRNYSQVDRMWSFLPTMHNAHFVIYAHMTGLPTQRLDTLLACSVVWSLRLTYNYWRKGGYQIGHEDYRWEFLRSKLSPNIYHLFSILFNYLFQSILLMLIATPTYILLLASPILPSMMTIPDIVFSRVLMALVLLEYFADAQQWTYQNAKKAYQSTAKVPPGFEREDLDRGFVVTGLWSWSRHPNFAAEQAFWVCLYQWAVWDTEGYFNWTIAGPLLYLALFQGSTWFTELITKGKYPEYAEYQRRVGKFVPKLSSELPEDKLVEAAQKAAENVKAEAKKD